MRKSAVSCSYVSKAAPNIYKRHMVERGQPRQSVPGQEQPIIHDFELTFERRIRPQKLTFTWTFRRFISRTIPNDASDVG